MGRPDGHPAEPPREASAERASLEGQTHRRQTERGFSMKPLRDAATTVGFKNGAVMTTTPKGAGTREDPWVLTTPPGKSEYLAYRDEAADPPALVVIVGKTELRYRLRCLDDLHAMLTARGDWMPLGSADEQKPAAVSTVEAWGRAADNPAGGWYGLKKGLRGRFANYVPPVLEALGLAEVEHEARDNRMRAR